MRRGFWERIPLTGGSLCLSFTERKLQQKCNETMVGS